MWKKLFTKTKMYFIGALFISGKSLPFTVSGAIAGKLITTDNPLSGKDIRDGFSFGVRLGFLPITWPFELMLMLFARTSKTIDYEYRYPLNERVQKDSLRNPFVTIPEVTKDHYSATICDAAKKDDNSSVVYRVQETYGEINDGISNPYLFFATVNHQALGPNAAKQWIREKQSSGLTFEVQKCKKDTNHCEEVTQLMESFRLLETDSTAKLMEHYFESERNNANNFRA